MIFYNPEADDGKNILSEEESMHCVKVLRKRTGDPIQVIDGKGTFFEATIIEDHSKRCAYEVNSFRTAAPDSYRLHLAIAPTKNADRMEWMLEKCVEIGLHEITFLQCSNSERTKLRTDRLEKKAISAMKQSGRPFATKINDLIKFNDFLNTDFPDATKHVAYVPASRDSPHLKDTIKGGNYIVLIGPEGDFSPQEINRAIDTGFMPTSLGNSRLRTETAGLATCHTLAVIHT